jgi:hypothetical protein
MTEEQIRDIKLIGLQTCPIDQGELFKSITAKDFNDPIWCTMKGYLLGVMHGKRTERMKRK